MGDFLVAGILLVLLGFATVYLWKEKKKGVSCIGCPGGCTGGCSGGSAGSCSGGSTGGCSGGSAGSCSGTCTGDCTGDCSGKESCSQKEKDSLKR